MNIKTRLLVSLLATASLTALTTWFVVDREYRVEISKIKAREQGFLNLVHSRSQGYASHAATVLEHLATDALLIDRLSKNDVGYLNRRLEEVLHTNHSYFQARWIDETGAERIRWQRINQKVLQIPSSELQDKSDRYYFKEAMRVEFGQIYFSRIDLNQEHGEVERPPYPTLRIATRLIDASGHPKGILVLNDDLSQFLAEWSSYITDSFHLFSTSGADWSKLFSPGVGWRFVTNEELGSLLHPSLTNWTTLPLFNNTQDRVLENQNGLFIWRSANLGINADDQGPQSSFITL